MLFSTSNGYCTFLSPGTQGRYRKNFYVRSSEAPHCPHCDGHLTVIGSRKRILLKTNGEKILLIVRRLRCSHCRKIHHELPDLAVPRKRHCTETIEEILTGRKDAAYPCETSTALRLRIWFSLLREYFERSLTAIKNLYQQEKQLTEELALLIPLSPASLPAGWLKRLVRILVNSGFWLQTRLA